LASSVVIQADVLDKAQRHAAEQAALLRVSKAAASGHQLRTVLADIASASLGIAGAERCIIELWRPITDETVVLAGTARDDFVDRKDRYTKVHSDLVCETAVRFGQDLGLPPDQIEALEIPGQRYDVGKIAVPDAVLRKPGYLSENDRHIMQQHVLFRELMLKGVPNLPLMLEAIAHHHERWDGTGYPYASGESISHCSVESWLSPTPIRRWFTTARTGRAAMWTPSSMSFAQLLARSLIRNWSSSTLPRSGCSRSTKSSSA
jgi:HD-GYP domain-containing protein (c-di-GMP phosphodiesterase class II)